MVILEVVKRIDAINADFELWFRPHERDLSNNIRQYHDIKVRSEACDVATDVAFQRSFCYFYGMRVVSRARRIPFFQRMEQLKHERPLDVDAQTITSELRPAMGKNYFSFVTKMLDMLEDETYPIYDSNVCKVFRGIALYGLENQSEVYTDILDTYRYLRNHEVLNRFRQVIDCNNVGYMKILDAIFLIIGKNL